MEEYLIHKGPVSCWDEKTKGEVIALMYHKIIVTVEWYKKNPTNEEFEPYLNTNLRPFYSLLSFVYQALKISEPYTIEKIDEKDQLVTSLISPSTGLPLTLNAILFQSMGTYPVSFAKRLRPSMQDKVRMGSIDIAYKLFSERFENNLGDNDKFTDGEVTQDSLHSIIHTFRSKCGMNHESFFMDMGSGAGKPVIHASLWTGARSYGIEINHQRWLTSLKFMDVVLKLKKNEPRFTYLKESIRCKCFFAHADIQDFIMPGITHLYSFDFSMGDYMYAYADSVNASPTIQWIASYRTPKEMKYFGFNGLT